MLTALVPVATQVAGTRQTLDYLLRQAGQGLDLEVVVVAAAPPPRVERLLAGYGKAVRRVAVPAGAGLAQALAAGTAAARGNAVVCLPPDALPRPDCLRALRDYAEAHPDAAVIGSLVVDPRDRVVHAGLVVGGDGLPHLLYAGFPANHPAVRSSRPVRAVSLAGAWWRRDACDAVGGLTADLDDLTAAADLGLRLVGAGHAAHLCAASPLCWLGGPWAETPPESEAAGRFRERWAGRLLPDDLSRYLADGLVQLEYLSPRLMRWTLDPAAVQVDEVARAAEVEVLLRELSAVRPSRSSRPLGAGLY